MAGYRKRNNINTIIQLAVIETYSGGEKGEIG